MSDLYLIAHKVRGEPAFDIAMRCDDMGSENDPGPWWIIPTSGHRAWPFWWEELSSLIPQIWDNPDHPCKFIPSEWRDHYHVNSPSTRKSALIDLADLGL